MAFVNFPVHILSFAIYKLQMDWGRCSEMVLLSCTDEASKSGKDVANLLTNTARPGTVWRHDTCSSKQRGGPLRVT